MSLHHYLTRTLSTERQLASRATRAVAGLLVAGFVMASAMAVAQEARPRNNDPGFLESIGRWFEEQGGAHWDGGCFVFDGREALDAALAPVSSSREQAAA